MISGCKVCFCKRNLFCLHRRYAAELNSYDDRNYYVRVADGTEYTLKVGLALFTTLFCSENASNVWNYIYISVDDSKHVPM